MYIGGLKKSLLQSLPYLAALVIPLLALRRKDADFPGWSCSFWYPWPSRGFFRIRPRSRWVVPQPSIFSRCLTVHVHSDGIRNTDLHETWGSHISAPAWAIIAIFTVAAFYLLTTEFPASLNDLEFPLLGLPLLIAGFLFALLIAGELIKTEGIRLLRSAALVLLIVAMIGPAWWPSFMITQTTADNVCQTTR